MTDETIKIKKMEPTKDFAFKCVFGMEDSKISLLSLLNVILNCKYAIKDVKIFNSVL